MLTILKNIHKVCCQVNECSPTEALITSVGIYLNEILVDKIQKVEIQGAQIVITLSNGEEIRRCFVPPATIDEAVEFGFNIKTWVKGAL